MVTLYVTVGRGAVLHPSGYTSHKALHTSIKTDHHSYALTYASSVLVIRTVGNARLSPTVAVSKRQAQPGRMTDSDLNYRSKSPESADVSFELQSAVDVIFENRLSCIRCDACSKDHVYFDRANVTAG